MKPQKPVVVIGGGGHGTVLLETLRLLGVEVIGVSDVGKTPGTEGPLGTTVLGGDEVIETFSANEILLVNGIGSIGSTESRRDVYERFSFKGYRFASVVHPSVILAADVKMAMDVNDSDGVQIMAGAVIQTGAHIESNAIINTRASVDHHCRIGRHVHIAPGVTLSGEVLVGNGVHIGTGANVKQGVAVGENSIVGAGVTVLADVPPGKLLHPAKSVVWTGADEQS